MEKELDKFWIGLITGLFIGEQILMIILFLMML